MRPSVGHAASEETRTESVQELRETLVRVTCRVDKITFFTYLHVPICMLTRIPSFQFDVSPVSSVRLYMWPLDGQVK